MYYKDKEEAEWLRQGTVQPSAPGAYIEACGWWPWASAATNLGMQLTGDSVSRQRGKEADPW